MNLQELFSSHLLELHAIVKKQNRSVHDCPNQGAMQAELDKLQAEQDNQTVSDNTVQQVSFASLEKNLSPRGCSKRRLG